MTLESSVARGNGRAGLALFGAGSTARLSNSVVTENGKGVSTDTGSTLLTRKNNTVSGNGDGPEDNVVGALTPLGGV
jgi:hypothetical protein